MDSSPQTRPWPQFLAPVLLGLLAACAGPGYSNPGPQPYPAQLTTTSVPPWYGLSEWQRLDQIEGWMKSNGPYANPDWLNPARLALADGLLSIDPGAGGRLLADRFSRARELYSTVGQDPLASDKEKRHAHFGLGRTDGTTVPRNNASTKLSNILPRSAWSARPARPEKMTPAGKTWKWITVHHSALSATSGTVQARSAQDVRTVQNGHMQAGRGYGDVGYHFIIDAGGRIWQGRELRWQGAHAGGSNNEDNIGICLLGNFDKIRPTQAALNALDRLVADLHRVIGVPLGRVRGHNDWKSTKCPGRHLEDHVARLR